MAAKHVETYRPLHVRGGHPQLVGYARASKDEAELSGFAAQQQELRKAGCSRIYTETASGASSMPILVQLLGELHKGETVVVVKLDRLSRRTEKLVLLLDELAGRDVFVRSISQGIDTRRRTQRDSMIGALAESARALQRERKAEGEDEASKRGKRGGRPPLLTPAKLEQIDRLRMERRSNRAIAAAVQLSEKSVRNAIDRLEAKRGNPRQLRLDGLSQ